MSRESTIEWCDGTVNPTMGCDGCELWSAKEKTCYAGVLHGRYAGRNKGFAPTFDQVTLFPGRMAKAAAWADLTGTDRLDKPWLNGMPRVIFVSDMSDALSKAVPFEYLKAEIVDVVNSENGRRHIWMWLTKQAPRMAEFSHWLASEYGPGWPMNLWAGTSVTTQATVARMKVLREVGDGNTTRFVSAEPLWEGVDLRDYLPWFKLVITGGASGVGARDFNIEWALSIIRQCMEAGAAVLVKQLGKKPYVEPYDRKPGGKTPPRFDLTLKDPKGGNWFEWPQPLRVRQFPQQPVPT